MTDAHTVQPHVFLSHATDDLDLARRLAADLLANGIEVFLDVYAITAGESIRRTVDKGFEACTHVVVLMTEKSIGRRWIDSELDTGFMLKLEGKAKLIVARVGVPASRLSPTLRPYLSPSLDDYDRDMLQLVSDIWGINEKPKLGQPPLAVRQRAGTGLSAGAEAIIRHACSTSEDGRAKAFAPEVLLTATGLTREALANAADELETAGLAKRVRAIGDGKFGFVLLRVLDEAFIRYDVPFGFGDPEADAKQVVSHVLNAGREQSAADHLARELGWDKRRLNPALAYLISKDLVTVSRRVSRDWVTGTIFITPASKRFAA